MVAQSTSEKTGSKDKNKRWEGVQYQDKPLPSKPNKRTEPRETKARETRAHGPANTLCVCVCVNCVSFLCVPCEVFPSFILFD